MKSLLLPIVLLIMITKIYGSECSNAPFVCCYFPVSVCSKWFDNSTPYKQDRLSYMIEHSSYRKVRTFINSPDFIEYHAKEKALYTASMLGKPDIVALLIEKGVLVNSNRNGSNPLYIASFCGHTSTVRLLIHNGADITAITHSYTALSIAAMKGHIDIVKLFVGVGADIGKDFHENFNTNALVTAMLHNHKNITEYLLQNGANPNSRNQLGETPLLLSCQYSSAEITTPLLLSFGADVNARDSLGNGALHHLLASNNPSISVVTILLKAGIDKNLKNNNGETALIIAKEYNYNDIVEELTR